MSDIPYPHQVQIHRPMESPSLQDDYGRPLTVAEKVIVVAAWVQEKSARMKAAWGALGAEVSTHTIFMEPRAFSVGSYITSVPGGGILQAERHKILGIRNPAGVGEHLEIDTVVVGSVESS